MLKATSRVSSRSPSLPSNAYILEKEHDYDSDATLDIDDVTPSGRPFGAPLRRMSEYGSPLNMPVQLLGSVADTPKKGLAVEVLTIPFCDFQPSQASSSSARPKRERALSTGGPLRKLVDKVVNKRTASSPIVSFEHLYFN